MVDNFLAFYTTVDIWSQQLNKNKRQCLSKIQDDESKH